jgi:hypothetical protein
LPHDKEMKERKGATMLITLFQGTPPIT